MKRFLLASLLLAAVSSYAQYNARERSAQIESELAAIRSYERAFLFRQRVVPSAPSLLPPGVNPKLMSRSEVARYYQIDKTLLEDSLHGVVQSVLMNGNKVTGANIYNYGSIGNPNFIANVNDIVWGKLGYVYEFGPLVASHVRDTANKVIALVTDGLLDHGDRDPVTAEVWGWRPRLGYSDQSQKELATVSSPDRNGDGKPDSWPSTWFNSQTGEYVWPGYLSRGATNADEEAFWGMDDFNNREFQYYPFGIGKPDLRGLGIQIEGRAFQWSNPLAEDAVFFVYTVQNVSPANYDSMVFGMYGDPHVGGQTDYGDDDALFIPPIDVPGYPPVAGTPFYARSMVYAWDDDRVGMAGLTPGYFGYKFLESPGNETDGKDNDGDGLIDESQTDGIDNDKDWNVATDDVGVDGVKGTSDQGEGDGIPTAGGRLPDGRVDPLRPGEPNFELTDLDESDQIGLTSFNAFLWASDYPSNDESMWNRMAPGNFTDIQQQADNVFIYGSGKFPLKSLNIKRFSIAMLFGENKEDLVLNAETVQRIYNANYRFFRPPDKPKLVVVPGDRRVTLYWDRASEESIDPLFPPAQQKDFEGYVLYRSTDFLFSDITTITDAKGTKFLSEPLKDYQGNEAKWDLVNGWKGYSVVPYVGRGLQYYLGNDRGVVHSYVDSNQVLNGQTYYYALVAYDHGDSTGIPPTETTKNITLDPITGRLKFDVNTAEAIPGPRVSGYLPPKDNSTDGIDHVAGFSTATIKLRILNDLAVRNGVKYDVTLTDTADTESGKVKRLNYSVLDNTEYKETITLKDSGFVSLRKTNVQKGTLTVRSAGGTVYTEGTDYAVLYAKGLVQRKLGGSIPNNSTATATFMYNPIFQSSYFNYEDYNPVFDGMLMTVKDTALAVDTTKTKWTIGNVKIPFVIKPATVGSGKSPYPADFEVRFSSTPIDSANISPNKKVPVKYSVRNVTENARVATFLVEKSATKDSTWTAGEEIAFFYPGSALQTTWGVTIDSAKIDSSNLSRPRVPQPGDILHIATSRPFTKNDKYSFTTAAASYAVGNKSQLDNIYVVPNPYVVVNSIEPTTRLPGQTRGERRIYFENLPRRATIRIFTMAGELVNVIEHNGDLESGREYWNLLNRDGIGIAYGVYFAHIDAPGIGEKIVKFAVIK